MQTNACGLDVT